MTIKAIVDDFLADPRSIEYVRVADIALTIKYIGYSYRVYRNSTTYCIGHYCTLADAKKAVADEKKRYLADKMDNKIARKRVKLENNGERAFYPVYSDMSDIIASYEEYKNNLDY